MVPYRWPLKTTEAVNVLLILTNTFLLTSLLAIQPGITGHNEFNTKQNLQELSSELLRTTNGFWSLSQPIMPVDGRGYLAIPPEYTHIKIDVGLSFNAPNSANWLDKLRLPGRFVIGIEPNANSLLRVKSGLRV